MEWVIMAIALLSWYFDVFAVCILAMVVLLPTMWMKYGLPQLYVQIIDDYPRDKCIVPKYCKKIFSFSRKHPGKNLPEDIYISGVSQYVGLIIVFIMLILIWPFNEVMMLKIGIIYIFASMFINIFLVFRGNKRAFYARYKVMNRHNFYRIAGWNGDDPSETYIGKCIILGEFKKRGRTFVTIQMRDGGKIEENVLLSVSKRTGENTLYSLYEICKVKYIT